MVTLLDVPYEALTRANEKSRKFGVLHCKLKGYQSVIPIVFVELVVIYTNDNWQDAFIG